MNRIIASQLSIRACVCGIVGMIPALGLLPALYALICWARLRRGYAGEWNPAARFLRVGLFFAILGLGLNVIAAASWAIITLEL